MDNIDKIHNNLEIAAFMGYNLFLEEDSTTRLRFVNEDTEESVYEDDLVEEFHCFAYHSSWDLLIPVLKRIEEKPHFHYENLMGEITHALLDYDLDSTYLAALTFIKSQ